MEQIVYQCSAAAPEGKFKARHDADAA